MEIPLFQEEDITSAAYDFTHLDQLAANIKVPSEELLRMKQAWSDRAYDENRPHEFSNGPGFRIRTRPDAIPSRSIYTTKDPVLIGVEQRKCAKEVERGIIRKCDDDGGWLASTILADKVKGNVKTCDKDYRLCQAYVGLNRWCIPDNASMPSEEELRRHICNAHRTTITDNANGFNQCQIAEEDRHKTKFITGDGQCYERIGAGFGLSVVPAQYTHRNESNFRDVEGFMSFVDDSATCTNLEDDEPSASTKKALDAKRASMTPQDQQKPKRLGEFGVKSAGEPYTRDNVLRIIDVLGAAADADSKRVLTAKELEADRQHWRSLWQLLVAAERSNTRFNAVKTQIAVPRHIPKSFYGRLWYDGFVTISDERMQGIASIEIPKNKSELLTFVCMMAWWSNSIPGLSRSLVPLTNQTKKDARFDMNLECRIAFDRCMWLLTNGICLYSPEPYEELHAYPDACDVAVGGAIMVRRAPKEVLRLEEDIDAWQHEIDRQKLVKKSSSPALRRAEAGWARAQDKLVAYLEDNGHPLTEPLLRWKTKTTRKSKGEALQRELMEEHLAMAPAVWDKRSGLVLYDMNFLKCVAFYSSKMPPAMKNYHVLDQELCATEFVVYKGAFMITRSWLPLVIHSDHKSLSSVLKGQAMPPDTTTLKQKRAWRALELMSCVDAVVRYIPGPFNVIGDCPSRLFRDEVDFALQPVEKRVTFGWPLELPEPADLLPEPLPDDGEDIELSIDMPTGSLQ